MMFDGYIIDKFTKDMLDEAVKKDKLEFLEESYLTGLIEDLYKNNGIVRIEILGNNRYDVLQVIHYLNNVLAKIMSTQIGVKIDNTAVNRIIVVDGTNPNGFIVESNTHRRIYSCMNRGEIKPKIDVALEVVGRKQYTKKKDNYLAIVYDRRYAKKGFLDITGAVVFEEHYRISDEVAYACLPVNHNPTRY